ncbi:MAG: phasin family protein [Anaerolineales bacterium]|nr:phasin family protein [Anaerolineales bacterium]
MSTFLETFNVEEIGSMRQNLVGNGRKLFQAGLGVMGLGQDNISTTRTDINEFIHKLMDRGQLLEEDGRKFFDDMMEKRKQQAGNLAEKAETQVEDRINVVLHRMNIPTKEDIDALATKIDTLNKKVTELKKAKLG